MSVQTSLLPEPRTHSRPTERRKYLRYVVNRECGVREKWTPWTHYETATVRDISCAGIGVLFHSQVVPGTALEVELRGVSSPRWLHAQVVRANELDDGNWFLGCELYRQLGDEELQNVLRAGPTDLSAPIDPHHEKRAWVRCLCAAKCQVREYGSPSERVMWAEARDVCPDGIGLVLPSRFEPGAILDLEFRGVQFPRAVVAGVVHATQQPDGTWWIGCKFARPLTGDEVHMLLDEGLPETD
jgi:hypothetical protein